VLASKKKRKMEAEGRGASERASTCAKDAKARGEGKDRRRVREEAHQGLSGERGRNEAVFVRIACVRV
jgi:hypothetical protein